MRDDVALRFAQVAEAIRDPDISVLWAEATDDERRVLIEELSKVSVLSEPSSGGDLRRSHTQRDLGRGWAQAVVCSWCRRGDLNTDGACVECPGRA
jgi:hypothetical protein